MSTAVKGCWLYSFVMTSPLAVTFICANNALTDNKITMVNADFFIVFGFLNVSLEFPLAHFVRGGMVRTVGHGRGKKMGGGGVSALVP